jgi:FAD/FMN-containing dehydrogenase
MFEELQKKNLDIIPKGDERIETYCEDTMMRAEPDAVVRARDERDVAEVIAYGYANEIPVTFCASQTSMTGAAVTGGGILVSVEKLSGVVDIEKMVDGARAVVRPGTITADFQRAVADAGWFFPVAPTSRDECCIGANIATNASGEDSFKYGPIRPYVCKLDLIMSDGSLKTIERKSVPEWTGDLTRAGLEMRAEEPIDLVIGSEGTLAFIAGATLDLLPVAAKFYTLLAPFRTNEEALQFIVDVSMSIHEKVRALELIDSGALFAMKTAEGMPGISDDVKSFVYLKQEYVDEIEFERTMELWYDKIVAASGENLAEAVLVAENDKQKEDFRLWRHRIPEWANERGRAAWDSGGAKVGSDWWVPVNRLSEMMAFFYDQAGKTGMDRMAYAHAGRGHPHTNLIATNREQLEFAHEVLLSCCKKAVSLGGGVAGEHGIGKMHRDLLPIQHDAETLKRMRAIKDEWDPKNILGRGTIF